VDGGRAAAQPVALDDLIARAIARGAAGLSAVIDARSGTSLSFERLAAEVESHRALLVALGWQRSAVVVLTMDEPDLLVAVLASLAAGVPFTIADPEQVIEPPAFDDRQVRRWDRLADLVDRIGPSAGTIDLRTPLPISQDAPAYLVSTSGTSGPPKWIVVPRRALTALIEGLEPTYALAPGDRVLRFFARRGDTVIEELVVTVAAGATVVVGHHPGSIPSLDACIRQHQVTVLQLPTSYWHQAVPHWARVGAVPAPVRVVIAGGETMRPDAVAAWSTLAEPLPRLVNAYGPSEATITSLTHTVDPTADQDHVPIGRPLPAVATAVVSAQGELIGAGRGELWLGGDQLASGYLSASAEEHARFVEGDGPLPGRWYRTGDQVERRANGDLVHLGRLDRQVKIAGQRVEPEQVEHHLHSHPDVQAAAVRPRLTMLGVELVATVVLEPGRTTSLADLRRHLRERLAPAAIPSRIEVAHDLALTATGKVDRSAELGGAPAEPGQSGDLRSWWTDLTGVEPTDDDRLIEHGISSLHVLGALATIEAVWGCRLHLRELVETTFGELQRRIGTEAHRATSDPVRIDQALVEGPLDPNQRAVWLSGVVASSDHVPVVTMGVRWTGRTPDLRAADLRTAIEQVARRHPALRTRCTFGDDGMVRQQVHHAPSNVELWSGIEPPDAAAALASQIAADPQGPAVRWAILSENTATVVVMVAHHAVADDASVAVLAADLVRAAAGAPLGPPTGGPLELAAAHDRMRTAVSQVEVTRRWAQRLAPPTDVPNTVLAGWPFAAPVGVGQRHRVSIDDRTARRLARTIVDVGASATSLALSLAGVVMHDLTGRARHLLSVPLTQRLYPELVDTVAMVLATVPMPIEVHDDDTWSTLVQRVHREVWSASTDGLVDQRAVLALAGLDRLGPVAVAGRTNEPIDHGLGHSVAADWVDTDLDRLVLPTALVLEAVLDDGALHLCVLADDGLDDRDVQAFVRAVHQAAERLAADPCGSPMAEPLIDLRSPVSPQPGVTAHGTATPALRPWWESFDLAGWAIVQLRSRGDAVAVIDGPRRWTARQLADRAETLAGELSAAGVQAGDAIALDLGPGADLATAVVACGLVGAVYVPSERSAPAHWRQMAADAAGITWSLGPGLDLTHQPGRRRPWPTAPPPAYVMFTSGSSGAPKAVAISHEAIARLVLHTDYADFGPDRVLAHGANPAFDASTFELWGALAHGACLVTVAREAMTDPRLLGEVIVEHHIDLAFVTTALLAVAAQRCPGAFAPLDTLLVGGEEMDPAWIRRVLDAGPPRRLVHVYGPTETTTFATWHEVRDLIPDRPVPIGGPVASAIVSVRRDDEGLTPAGMVGELWIGGPGLGHRLTAQGSWNDPAFLTRDGQRWYRTGDLVRTSDGGLEFVGRADAQVKVRGHRIDLGEIETALRRLDGVTGAAAAIDGTGPAARIVAVVTGEHPLDDADLRRRVGELLRPHAVPAIVAQVGDIGTTANAKIDRYAVVAACRRSPTPPLPEPGDVHLALVVHCVTTVAGRPVGARDRLDQLALSSLATVQLMQLLERHSGQTLALSQVMAAAEVSELATLIGTCDERPADVVVLRHGVGDPVWLISGPSTPPTVFGELAHHLTTHRPVWALNLDDDPSASVEALGTRVAGLVSQHRRNGRVVVAGYSIGALIAIEAVRQLGEAVPDRHVILIDPILHVRAERWRAPRLPHRGTVLTIVRRLRNPAATYSPRGSTPKYHRRRQS
jgi:surfactin family lipopeptide synthetase A